ncbi:MAG: TonB-dependent receptor [Terriglobia bacterium]|jgi:hypothetical protein
MATIVGTVTDASGAVVPDAAIEILNQNTGIKTTTKSNAEGAFVVPELPVAVYTVSVTKNGFNTYSQTGIELHPATTATVRATLQAGSVVSTVTVQASATTVQTSTPEVASQISTEEVYTLPLNGRNFQTLGALMPGVINLTPDSALGQGNFQGTVAMSINGMGSAGSVYYLDGAFDMNGATATIQPPPDAIQEVRVLANNYGTQYNLQGSSTVLVETKSGTDQFHLTAFEYLRNTDFNARNFFSPSSLIMHQNIFGGTLGGPLFFPFHRPKNPQTFFFASIQAALLSDANTITGATPTAAMRQGTFSSKITDPVTGQPFPNAGGVYQIPSGMLNANSLALMNATEPLPNYVSPAGGITNYINVNPIYTRTRDDEIKVDHNFGSRTRLMGEYIESRQLYRSSYNTIINNPFPTSYSVEPSECQTGHLTLTTTLTPSMVNTASISTAQLVATIDFNGIVQQNQVPAFSENLPYKGGYNQQFLPTVAITGGWASFGGPSQYPLYHASTMNNELSDDWSYLRGHHYLQAGVMYHKGTKRQNSFAPSNGSWSFSGQFTGSGVADYLIGDGATFTQASSQPRFYAHNYMLSPYFQDQWKATRRLTLTAGLRWMAMPGTNLQPGLEAIFNPSLYNPAATPIVHTNGTITPTASYSPTNGLMFNGVNGVPLNFTTEHWSYLSPSAGFAWDIFGDGKTALRGGYGISYNNQPYQSFCANQCAVNPPLIQTINLVTPSFPNPIGATVKPSAAPSLNSEDRNDRSGQIQTFSLSLEHQFGGSWFTSITGAGDLGRHLTSLWNINQPLPDAPYDFNPVINAGTTFNYLYSPFQGFAGISQIEPALNANWYGLEVGVRHPVGHNVSLTIAYTWQHALSEIRGNSLFDNETGPVDVYNPSLDYGNAATNVPQSLSFGYIYNLPWYHNAKGWRKQALGGWRYSGLSTIESGFSQNPGLSVAHPGLSNRPNRVSGSVVGPKTVKEWFNTGAFAAPAAGYFGSAAPGSIYGPGLVDFDMAIYKDFSINERHKVEFRAEAFNVFNHTNFNAVGTSFGSGTYGELTSARDPRVFEFALRYQF